MGKQLRKTVVIDARSVGQFGHGIAKYVEGIAQAILDEEKTQLLSAVARQLSVPRNSIEFVFIVCKELPISSKIREFRVVETTVRPFKLREWWVVPRILHQLSADLFVNPSFVSFPFLPTQYFQTVHDLNHLHFGSTLHRIYYRYLLRRSLRAAAKVFTVSETILSELKSWLGPTLSTPMVDYNRVDLPIAPSISLQHEILARFAVQTKRYFLAIDSEKPHKNITYLRTQFESYEKNESRPEFQNDWIVALRRISGKEKYPLLVVSKVSDDELATLYLHCAALCYPSVYEGFGRPPVEAALLGAAVLASKIAAHEEAKAWLKTRDPQAAARIELLKIDSLN